MNKIIFFQLMAMHPLFKSERVWFERLTQFHKEFFEDIPSLQSLLEERPLFLQYWNANVRTRDHLARDWERAFQKGIRWVVRGDPDYPKSFLQLDDPPWWLSYWGRLSIFLSPAISVVGSREPQLETFEWMETEFRQFLRSTRASVVSGGARGVDQWAHVAALREGVSTAVVLPSGLERFYPTKLENLRDEILEQGGCVLSEFPLTCSMQKSFFQHRNRLIAAAGISCLVVQAEIRSGTMITADRAAHIGRPVWVLPSHPRQIRFSGNLKLLTEGATMVKDAHDLSAYWHEEVKFFQEQSLAVGLATDGHH